MIGELFDPRADLSVASHFRPHWSQAGAIVFVTFRTEDSIPKQVAQRWHAEKVQWLEQRGVTFGGDFTTAVAELSLEDAAVFRKHFNRQREMCLDECYGACVLRSSHLAKIVADSLLHFDGERYHIGDFVVMPNHVHLLASFKTEEGMRKQFTSWLHWTAREINRVLGLSGHFWQEEPFDHLVRSNEQYEYLKRYIRENPVKAGLKEGDFIYHQAES
ncbi:MAG: transposase [Planctomycetota bacterium]